MQLFAKFEKILWRVFSANLNFHTELVFESWELKAKIKGFLAGHIVAMVTCYKMDDLNLFYLMGICMILWL